jgi:membrane-associated phospholipid phosphatase
MVSSFNDRLFLAINEFARDTPWLHGIASAYAQYGVVLFALALLVTVWHCGRRTARALAASVWAGLGTLLAVAINQPMGHLVAERRPYADHPHVLVLVSRTTDYSFPSDHAVMAGAVATGVWIVWRAMAYVVGVLAVLMAFTRVYVGAHYPGDVVAGLILGAVVVLLGWWLLGTLLTSLAARLRDSRFRPLVVSGTSGPAAGVSRAGATASTASASPNSREESSRPH